MVSPPTLVSPPMRLPSINIERVYNSSNIFKQTKKKVGVTKSNNRPSPILNSNYNKRKFTVQHTDLKDGNNQSI